MHQQPTEIVRRPPRAATFAPVIFALTALLPAHVGAAEVPRIILCPGTQIVTAISESAQDYESIKTIERMDSQGMQLRYSSERLVFEWLNLAPPELKTNVARRFVRNADMDSASRYLQHFADVLPEMVPETTAISISRATFSKLKSEGQAEFAVFVPFNVDKPSIDREVHPNVYDNQMWATVTRASDSPALKVTVNGSEVSLPTMRFTGDFYGDKSEFIVLDDEDTPLMLAFRIGIEGIPPLTADEIGMRKSAGRPTTRSPDKEVLRVVKIEGVCTPAVVAEVTPPPTPPKPAPIVLPDAPPVDVPPSPPMVATGEAPVPSAGDTPSPSAAPESLPAPVEVPPSPPMAATTEVPEPAAEPPPVPARPDPPPSPPPPPPAAPVEFPKAAAETARLEKAIVDTGRVDIQSIYFTVNSANIRPESDVALNAIANVLAKHGDWQMSVEGHTDSQGEDAFNLDLSKRRAAAVKTALETRFAIAASRLTTAGFGETKPVADNATLEGRAHNRRVQFVKQ